MASVSKRFSESKFDAIDAKDMRIGIIVSEWSSEVTEMLYEGCQKILKKSGVKNKNIYRLNVPGSFELPFAAKMFVESRKVDAVICLGCIVKGETRHDEFISQAVSKGIMDLNLRYNIPFVFGVLTTFNNQQAIDRAGGKHGNKGAEAAVTAIRMVGLKRKLQQ